jgi:DNA-binding beta-propeller fold protein YncE
MSDRFDFLELDTTRPLRSAGSGVAPDRPEAAPAPLPLAPGWKIREIIGGPGSRAGQFSSPGGLAVDAAGNLLVADSYNHRVQRITPAGEVYVLGRRGTGPGEFLNPQAVVADESLGFFVLEQGGCRIQRFGPQGEWQGAFGFRGAGWGEMLAPTAMSRGPCGSLFVADTGNNRIIKWSSDDVFVDAFPRASDAPLVRPLGLTVDRAGRVWVAETPRHRLVVLDALLRWLGTLGREGAEPGEFQEPQGVGVTPGGQLIVSDTGNDRLQVLDQRGQALQVIGGRNGASVTRGVGPISAPSGLAVPRDDEAYVSDTGNHRILRLGRENG